MGLVGVQLLFGSAKGKYSGLRFDFGWVCGWLGADSGVAANPPKLAQKYDNITEAAADPAQVSSKPDAKPTLNSSNSSLNMGPLEALDRSSPRLLSTRVEAELCTLNMPHSHPRGKSN